MEDITQIYTQAWLVETTFQVFVLSAIAYIAFQSFKKSRNKKYKISDGKILAFTHFGLALLLILFLFMLSWGPFPTILNPVASYILNLISSVNQSCDTTTICSFVWFNALVLPILLSASLILTTIVYLFEKNILKKFSKNHNLWNYYFILSSVLFVLVTTFFYSMPFWY